MNEKTVQKIFDESEEFASDLMDISKYPPFTIFDEKKKTLINFIKSDIYGLASDGNEVFVLDGDNMVIDNSKKKGIDALAKLEGMLKDRDKSIPEELLNDVEEARLYRKRHGDPFKALYAASEVYPETDTRKHIF